MKRTAVLAIAAALTLGACSSADGDAVPVEAALVDYSITLSPAEVPAGRVSFAISNTGDLTHEFEVLEGNGDSITVDKGVADTSSLTVIDEVEDIIPGGTPTLTVDLESGVYTVLCNLPEHYERGMVTTLTVTP